MDDLTRSAKSLGGRLEPQWTEEHIDEALASVHIGLHRRRRRKRIATAALVVMSFAVALLAMHPGSPTSEKAVREPDMPQKSETLADRVELPPSPLEQQELRFGERAVAIPLVANTMLIAESVGKDAINLRLREGAARFQVNKDPGQSFRVHAGPVVVVVLGTEFDVRRASDYVEVRVAEGSVEVLYDGETVRVDTGETRRFLLDIPAKRQRPPSQDDATESRKLHELADVKGRDDDTTLPQRPVAELDPEPKATEQPSGDSASDLLHQADMARLRQEHRLAAQILKRVLAANPNADAEVIAAFSLGRVLMDKLGRPAEAADAFARARAADPNGNLAEDSLAREVQAHARAGSGEAARTRATEYLKLYPTGRRRRMVMSFGDLN